MFNQDDPKGPSRGEQIGLAVAIATITAFTTGLVGWGLGELRLKFGSKPKAEPAKEEVPAKAETKDAP